MRNTLASHLHSTKLPFLPTLRTALPAKAEVYIVGGAVRDALLNRKTKDIDIVVRNVSPRTLLQGLRKKGPVELVGKRFGVFKWMPRGWHDEAIDVALPRRDHAFGTGGYKDVKTQSNPRLSLKDDVQRRDFTINALAYDIKQKKLIDHVGGVSDLAAKILRPVGDPVKRFSEDYSRILRALRFSVTLQFSIEPQTSKVMRIMMGRLLEQTKKGEWVVPRETIAKELIRMFVADPLRAFDAAFFYKVFAVLMPEVMDMRGCPQPKEYHVEGDVLQHTRSAIEQLVSPAFKKLFPRETPTAELIFATLLHDIAKPTCITFPAQDSKDRIRYHNHDTVGATMAHTIAARLHLAVFAKNDTTRHVDADALSWLVRNHLVGFRNTIREMRPATIEKYYCNAVHPSHALLRLQFADTAATVGKSGKPDMRSYALIYKVVSKLHKVRKTTAAKPLLSGHDIMALGIPEGKGIGKALDELRNAQLKGTVKTALHAKAFVKRLKLS